MTERRFPAPWKVEEQPACFVVRDHYEQALAYIYYEEEPGRSAAEKLLTKDEARRIARITMRARLFWLTAIGLALSACSIQRGQIANDAQAKMIGLSKEQVLACMGPPLNKDTGGAAEVWSYNSGKGGNCNVKVTIKDDHVSAVDYSGLTGGLLSPNEQCAYALLSSDPCGSCPTHCAGIERWIGSTSIRLPIGRRSLRPSSQSALLSS